MSDFNVKITVRNARLLRAIRERADSVAEFCRTYGLQYPRVSALVAMNAAPVRQDGTLTATAVEVLSALGCEAEEIWPRHMERLKLKRATAEIELSADQVAAIASDEGDPVKRAMQRQMIGKWAKSLSPAEAEIVARRVSGETYEEVAKSFGVTRERIRQREQRGLRKMRMQATRSGVQCIEDAL